MRHALTAQNIFRVNPRQKAFSTENVCFRQKKAFSTEKACFRPSLKNSFYAEFRFRRGLFILFVFYFGVGFSVGFSYYSFFISAPAPPLRRKYKIRKRLKSANRRKKFSSRKPERKPKTGKTGKRKIKNYFSRISRGAAIA